MTHSTNRDTSLGFSDDAITAQVESILAQADAFI
jgi:hypothetical protein